MNDVSTKLLELGSTRKGIAVNIIRSMGDQSNPPELSGVKIPKEEVEAETSGSKDAEDIKKVVNLD